LILLTLYQFAETSKEKNSGTVLFGTMHDAQALIEGLAGPQCRKKSQNAWIALARKPKENRDNM
jgi:hypothetical protein